MKVVDLPEGLAAAAVALWHEAGLTRPWNDPDDDLRRAREGPSSTVLAALSDDGDLLGTAMVGADGHRGWLYYLAVRHEARGRGTGRALVEASEAWLRAAGVPKVQLMVRRGNVGVVGLYEHLGYEQADVVVLGKRLGGPSWAAPSPAEHGRSRLGHGCGSRLAEPPPLGTQSQDPPPDDLGDPS